MFLSRRASRVSLEAQLQGRLEGLPLKHPLKGLEGSLEGRGVGVFPKERKEKARTCPKGGSRPTPRPAREGWGGEAPQPMLGTLHPWGRNERPFFF